MGAGFFLAPRSRLTVFVSNAWGSLHLQRGSGCQRGVRTWPGPCDELEPSAPEGWMCCAAELGGRHSAALLARSLCTDGALAACKCRSRVGLCLTTEGFLFGFEL